MNPKVELFSKIIMFRLGAFDIIDKGLLSQKRRYMDEELNVLGRNAANTRLPDKCNKRIVLPKHEWNRAEVRKIKIIVEYAEICIHLHRAARLTNK